MEQLKRLVKALLGLEKIEEYEIAILNETALVLNKELNWKESDEILKVYKKVLKRLEKKNKRG